MPGLTAKVFRTYNASFTMKGQLATIPVDLPVVDKILLYNRANRTVAELCNHQRAKPKTHGATVERLNDKTKALKYQRMKLRYTLFSVEDGNSKKYKAYKEMESDLDDDWCEQHEMDLVEKEKQKITKKFEKDNEKRKAEDEEEMPEKELKELLKGAEALGEQIAEERKSK